MRMGLPSPPCRKDGKECELRGSEVCHTDKCPYGWAEFQEQVRARREANSEARRRDRIVPVPGTGRKRQW